ncbi:MAG TPA: ATP-binding protein [Bacteroidales bacterium]|nr:ATP-binding protein [Bacteroidales bacterium]HPS62655.1 ATP-binding protein [Bacteroidales bacterium]
MKEIILDAQAGDLFTGTLRTLTAEGKDKKATVLIGVRRCGKSTWLNQEIARLISSGVKRENILYINFFDDRLAGLSAEGPDKVLEAYYMLYPEKKNKEKIFCFFDEIQMIRGWESFIDRILRTEKCSVYLTGSSANLLSKEIATHMRGRALSWELFPFSFEEFLSQKGIAATWPATSRNRLLIRKSFDDYYETGGFPEVIETGRQIRVKIHQEYLSSILFRDLIERYDISHPRAVVDLVRRMMENAGSLYTLNALTGYLQSLGHKAPKNSVADYLAWAEDAYFLFTVKMYSASYGKSNVNPKKIYCIDHALLQSVTSGILINRGHLLENMVFIALRRQVASVYYYRTAAKQEVDFIFKDLHGKPHLIQVCETLVNPQTRQRETASLQNAMMELGISRSMIVTLDETEEIPVPAGTIEVIPIWQFLLSSLTV